MSNQSIAPYYADGVALAHADKAAGREPRYTEHFVSEDDRTPFRKGYLSLVDGKEWA